MINIPNLVFDEFSLKEHSFAKDICLLFDNPLTLQEESGLKLALYGCDGGARSKRASVLTLLVSRLVGGEILKKGVDQPLSHFIIPFY
ncbi:hypothetical protein HpBT081_03000 [Helicobacter pylori]